MTCTAEKRLRCKALPNEIAKIENLKRKKNRMAELKNLKNVSARDRKMLEDAEQMLGPEPSEMGFVKNLFWGNFQKQMIRPYPQVSEQEKAKCDAMLARLDDYLKNEHPAVQIDQEQEIPRWVIDRLCEIGVMGMTIPEEYGGSGLGVTSYNRILARIGESCGSTAVLVSAHQSIGCKAIMLFGNEEQKKKYLPGMAKSDVSAFCLSEPNVGCDAGGQETTCRLSEDGTHYILNGEKKWSTSGAISGLFTVMAKQKIVDDKTGKTRERVTALICTPDLPGIDIYEKNRSKCGIRGTWQARIRFTDARVPKENLLHKEGKGLAIALSCLNYGRCTLSAGMLGSARRCMEQAIKWSQTRYQFKRPIGDFELVQKRIAHMAALTYAMDATLYLTTALLDRHEKDIMLETALCKVFCSEMGWQVIYDAMQIMGGESYMTENEMERAFRDSRINLIVEGANEVMQSFVFGYGGKQLAEQMVTIQQALGWNSDESLVRNVTRILSGAKNTKLLSAAVPLGLELFFGRRQEPPEIRQFHSSLRGETDRLAELVRDLNHNFKLVSKKYREDIISRQAVQARIADSAMWLYAMSAALSRFDQQLKRSETGKQFERDQAAALHFCDLAARAIKNNFRELDDNADDSMKKAARAAVSYNDTLPNESFIIPEWSPVARGTGRKPSTDHVKQFPGDKHSIGLEKEQSRSEARS
jgi:acyl-CoA dehydrogenase family protein 9